MVRYNTESFIDKAVNIHGNKYDYSKVQYNTFSTKLTIICKEHGEFTITPNSHIGKQQQGCAKCGIYKRALSNKRTTAEFINESKQIHGDIYDYSTTEYVNCDQKVKVICSVHGEFMLTPTHHLRKIGCAKCGTNRMADSHRSSTKIYIDKANNVHNNLYDYSKLEYINSKTNITIICKLHGEFSQLPTNHLNGSKCPTCALEHRATIRRDTHDEFIKKAQIIHGNKYDYSLVKYSQSNAPIDIICKLHGTFIQTAGCHLQGSGCIKCGYDYFSTEDFIRRSIECHGNKYDYTQSVYNKHEFPIKIICKQHGAFYQKPKIHMRGAGCQICARQKQIGRISKVSKEWLDMITVNRPSIEFEFHIPNTNYYADGYDKMTNTIYEFHGDYWHGNPELYASDMINKTVKCTMGDLYKNTIKKKEICISLGYHYVEMWEQQWKKFKACIKKVQTIIHKTNQN